MLSFQRVAFCSLGSLATLALSTGTASASPILNYQVTTGSCFNCTTDGSFFDKLSDSGYTFEGVTEWDGETDPSGNATVILGTLTRNNENYSQDETNDRDFVVRVAFLPFGIVGDAHVFVARIVGTQGQPGNLEFDKEFTTYTFSNEFGAGSFQLRVNDILSLSKNDSATLTGSIQNVVLTPTTVPEPASLLLLGSGLAVAARRFRRRESK